MSGNSFTFSSPAANQNVDIGQSTTRTVIWIDNGSPEANQIVNIFTTRGMPSTSSGVTNASGTMSVAITSVNAESSLISGSAAGISAQISINFVATMPNNFDLRRVRRRSPRRAKAPSPRRCSIRRATWPRGKR